MQGLGLDLGPPGPPHPRGGPRAGRPPPGGLEQEPQELGPLHAPLRSGELWGSPQGPPTKAAAANKRSPSPELGNRPPRPARSRDRLFLPAHPDYRLLGVVVLRVVLPHCRPAFARTDYNSRDASRRPRSASPPTLLPRGEIGPEWSQEQVGGALVTPEARQPMGRLQMGRLRKLVAEAPPTGYKRRKEEGATRGLRPF